MFNAKMLKPDLGGQTLLGKDRHYLARHAHDVLRSSLLWEDRQYLGKTDTTWGGQTIRTWGGQTHDVPPSTAHCHGEDRHYLPQCISLILAAP